MSQPMYKSYDALDMNMIGLYNYLDTNNIKFCYLMGEIDEQQIDIVVDVNNLGFLQNKRDSKYNWYDNSRIEIVN